MCHICSLPLAGSSLGMLLLLTGSVRDMFLLHSWILQGHAPTFIWLLANWKKKYVHSIPYIELCSTFLWLWPTFLQHLMAARQIMASVRKITKTAKAGLPVGPYKWVYNKEIYTLTFLIIFLSWHCSIVEYFDIQFNMTAQSSELTHLMNRLQAGGHLFIYFC